MGEYYTHIHTAELVEYLDAMLHVGSAQPDRTI
jgi:hypothetical protein